MRIGDIIKEQQPKEYKKLNKNKKEKLTEKDIKELMQHRHYRRTKGGALKQIN